MRIKTPFFDIKVDIIFIIIMFIFLFSNDIRSFLSSYLICYLFIVFHESSHMFVATLFGKEIEIFNIGLFGVNIVFKKLHYNLEENYLSKKYLIRDIFIFLAGPLSNLILAIIFKNIKVVYDINIFLCILNLIPVYPLDGYNIFKNILLLKLDERNTDKIINIISYIVFLVLFICGILIFILLYNPSFVLFLIYLVILKLSYKNSKKHTKYYN